MRSKVNTDIGQPEQSEGRTWKKQLKIKRTACFFGWGGAPLTHSTAEAGLRPDSPTGPASAPWPPHRRSQWSTD